MSALVHFIPSPFFARAKARLPLIIGAISPYLIANSACCFALAICSFISSGLAIKILRDWSLILSSSVIAFPLASSLKISFSWFALNSFGP